MNYQANQEDMIGDHVNTHLFLIAFIHMNHWIALDFL